MAVLDVSKLIARNPVVTGTGRSDTDVACLLAAYGCTGYVKVPFQTLTTKTGQRTGLCPRLEAHNRIATANPEAQTARQWALNLFRRANPDYKAGQKEPVTIVNLA